MEILLLCDDLWHPAEVITRAMRVIAENDWNLDIVTAPKEILTLNMLEHYQVILNARCNEHRPANAMQPWFERGVTPVMPQDFESYVRSGGGFLALHSGTCYTEAETPEMTRLLGCEFLGHPPAALLTAMTEQTHPLIDDTETWNYFDEPYRIRLLVNDASVFLKYRSNTDGIAYPAGYTRLVGNGRVCCLTPGHFCAALEQPQYVKLLQKAILWCAFGDKSASSAFGPSAKSCPV